MTADPLVQRLPFGECEGVPIEQVVLRTAAGAEARIINWGAVLRDLVVPLVNGRRQRVVLGLPTLADYLAYSPHFGSVEGRLANRLAEARFTLDGRIVQVAANRGTAATPCTAAIMDSAAGPGGSELWAPERRR
jgi:galactose mutarotase-like enzyme